MSTYSNVSKVPRKDSKEVDRVEHDHISNLSDCVLSHILSCLPTKDAVRTSILSKEWKLKWTCIYKLDFFKRSSAYLSKKDTFYNFVERTLLLSQNIQSFRLTCYGKRNLSDVIKTWIVDALSRDVHCLEIFYREEGYQEAGFLLAPSLVSFYSLRKLTLNIPCAFKASAKICFPYLKTLKLVRVEILNELSISEPLKFRFPVLESFELRVCKWLNVKRVEICAPKMTTFYSETEEDTGYSVAANDYSIKIVGDRLEMFGSYGGLPENIVLSGGSEVASAVMRNSTTRSHSDLLKKSGLHLRNLLNGLSSLKHLELSGTMTKAIAFSESGLSLLKFNEMERLVMYYVTYSDVLLGLLHAMPFLKILDLKVTPNWHAYDYDAVEAVPPCIVSHLEEVMFEGFIGKKDEMKFAKFILKNAVNLKRLHVSCKKAVEELSTYPKVSTCATIVVY